MVAVAGVLFSFVNPPEPRPLIRTVSFSGQHAPGTSADERFMSFSSAVINSTGHVSFFARVLGDDVYNSNQFGVWSEGGGSLQLIARDGMIAPGARDGATFQLYGYFLGPFLTANGQTTFLARLRAPQFQPEISTLSDTGIWTADKQGLRLAVREGEASAPGSVLISGLGGPLASADGSLIYETLFLSNETATPIGESGLWTFRGGVNSPLALVGERPPGTPEGVSFRGFINSSGFENVYSINKSGHIVFRAFITGPDVTDRSSVGYWTDRNGDLTLVMRGGEPVPGLTTETVLSNLGNPVMNAAGQVAFHAFLTGGGVGANQDEALFIEENGTVTLLAREGMQAPGEPPSVQFKALENPVLNDAGKAV